MVSRDKGGLKVDMCIDKTNNIMVCTQTIQEILDNVKTASVEKCQKKSTGSADV